MRTEPVFELSGGALALDLANTVEKRPVSDGTDLLRDYDDLAAWASQAGILERARAERLRAAARRSARAAERALERAVRLREAIFRVFAALAAADEPAEDDVELIRKEAVRAWERGRLARKGEAFGWDLGSGELDAMVGPVAVNALELLQDAEAVRSVRECASETCAWLFLDRSRNRSRRWCDMKVCGNRAKSRRHYQRTREENAP